jgi:hypothetical protein
MSIIGGIGVPSISGEAHRKYFDDILNTSITDNPKKFYSYIKQKKSGQSNIPVIKRNTEILSEPKDKAIVLNDPYTPVFTREPPGQLPDIDGTPIPPMTDIKFTSPGVEKLLQKRHRTVVSWICLFSLFKYCGDNCKLPI